MPDVVGLLPTDPQHIARYRVLGRLGSGGQGVVYLGESPDGRRVAIKQLLRGLPELADSRARRQLGKEVAAAQRVAPFCTAQILDADVTGDSPYIVSEYIEGPSLQQLIRTDGPLTGSSLQWMAIGTATALAAIHQAGVVHRDFKPANVMMAADGPRVIDFGIARDLSTDVTVTSRVMGTPAYMAPEQVRNEPMGPATDLFAWASVVAYAATGRAPFEAGHMLAVAQRITSEEPDLSGVPAPLVPVLRRCLAKDPAERPTAQQVLGMLLGKPDTSPAQAAGLVHRAATPLTAPALTAKSPPAEKSYVWQTLAAAGVVLLLGLGVWGWAQAADRREANSPTPTASPTLASTPAPTYSTPATEESTPEETSTSDGPVVPAGLAGDWEGTGIQPNGQVKSWTARIRLDEGDTGGTLELKELDCSGTLSIVSASSRQLRMEAEIDEDDDGLCAPSGTVTLTLLTDDSALFLWQDDSMASNTATGTLSRN